MALGLGIKSQGSFLARAVSISLAYIVMVPLVCSPNPMIFYSFLSSGSASTGAPEFTQPGPTIAWYLGAFYGRYEEGLRPKSPISLTSDTTRIRSKIMNILAIST